MDDQRLVYEALIEAQDSGSVVVLVTVVRTSGSIPRHAGSKMLIYADGKIVGTVGGGAMESEVIQVGLSTLSDGQPKLVSYTLNNIDEGDVGICGGTAELFIEPINLPITLLVIGGGHVGKALAELGKWAGYRVILCDDRAEFCNPDYVPDLADYVVCKPLDILEYVSVNKQTYVAAVTRGLPVDIDLIPKLLATDAPYIGLIGSQRRWAITHKTLLENGISADDLVRIRAPIGLELEAETPKEIAVSILAEMIMLRRGGTGNPMQSHNGDESTAG